METPPADEENPFEVVEPLVIIDEDALGGPDSFHCETQTP